MVSDGYLKKDEGYSPPTLRSGGFECTTETASAITFALGGLGGASVLTNAMESRATTTGLLIESRRDSEKK